MVRAWSMPFGRHPPQRRPVVWRQTPPQAGHRRRMDVHASRRGLSCKPEQATTHVAGAPRPGFSESSLNLADRVLQSADRVLQLAFRPVGAAFGLLLVRPCGPIVGCQSRPQLLALKQFDGAAWRGIPTPHVSVIQIVRVHPMVPPGADASPEQLHHPGWCSDAPYSENSL
jgi:hypothetical protein